MDGRGNTRLHDLVKPTLRAPYSYIMVGKPPPPQAAACHPAAPNR
jgi:hypothetical protein